MLSRPRKLSGPNGITATTMSVGTSRTIGARVMTQWSASSGVVSSLVISFIMSAIGWSRPKGPQRLGPEPVLEASERPALEPGVYGRGHDHGVYDDESQRARAYGEHEPIHAFGQEAVEESVYASEVEESGFLYIVVQRSTSPRTMSTEPNVVIRSPILPPISIFLSGVRLMNDGARALQR